MNLSLGNVNTDLSRMYYDYYCVVVFVYVAVWLLLHGRLGKWRDGKASSVWDRPT